MAEPGRYPQSWTGLGESGGTPAGSTGHGADERQQSRVADATLHWSECALFTDPVIVIQAAFKENATMNNRESIPF